jgi:hypothetical protein
MVALKLEAAGNVWRVANNESETMVIVAICNVPRVGPAEPICRGSARHREDANLFLKSKQTDCRWY